MDKRYFTKSLSSAKSYCTEIFGKMHYQLNFIELIIYKDLTYEAPLLLRI